MGQQQLLLLVLGMVIVGIAVVAGIQAFSEGQQKAERDAAISDAMRVISDLQAWKLKPTAFGGGDNGAVADFAPNSVPVTFQHLGINPGADDGSDADKYETINGCFELAGAVTGATLTVYLSDCSTEVAEVTVDGSKVSNISWAYAAGGS